MGMMSDYVQDGIGHQGSGKTAVQSAMARLLVRSMDLVAYWA